MTYVIDLLLLLVFFNGLHCIIFGVKITVVKQIHLRCTQDLKL